MRQQRRMGSVWLVKHFLWYEGEVRGVSLLRVREEREEMLFGFS